MSFGSEARKELTRQHSLGRDIAGAQLAGALMCTNAVSFRGRGRYKISFTVDSASIIRYFFSEIKDHFGVVCEIRTIRVAQLRHRMRYRLTVPEEAVLDLMKDVDMLDEEALFGIRSTVSERVLNDEERMIAFLRGAFMVCGSMTNPEKAYHLEFAVGSEGLADEVKKILRNFENGVKTACRKSQFVVYLKNSEQIVELLSRLGANNARLETENVLIQKQVLNLVNRQTNCDATNIRRTMKTAETQIQDIEYIDAKVGLDRLSGPLRDIAIVRLNNPSTSLADLGDLLEPPIGKSGVNNRLRRLTAIAEKLRRGEDVDF